MPAAPVVSKNHPSLDKHLEGRTRLDPNSDEYKWSVAYARQQKPGLDIFTIECMMMAAKGDVYRGNRKASDPDLPLPDMGKGATCVIEDAPNASEMRAEYERGLMEKFRRAREGTPPEQGDGAGCPGVDPTTDLPEPLDTGHSEPGDS
jgi:hypothetical protein